MFPPFKTLETGLTPDPSACTWHHAHVLLFMSLFYITVGDFIFVLFKLSDFICLISSEMS